MVRPDGARDPIAGPDTPQSPYPLRLRGPVIKGFGRGSKELGIPTANIPIDGLSINGHTDLESGIYYGWASLDHSTIPSSDSSASNDAITPAPESKSSNHAVADLEAENGHDAPVPQKENGITVYPTVLSIGYNPFYANTSRSIEIHILHQFPKDFYGATLSLIILGYIRPEYDYVSKDALVEDIREDIRVARRSLDREGYEAFRGDAWLSGAEELSPAEGKMRGLQYKGQTGGTAMCQMEN